MSPLPDTSNVEINDFPPIKSDWYEVIFENDEEKESKAGKTYTKITLKSATSERLAWCNLNYGEESLWMVKSFKQAISMPDQEGNLRPYRGTHLMAFLQNREYEGQNYAEAKKFKALGETIAEAEPDSDLPF